MRSTWIVNASGGVMLAVLVGQSGALQRQPADGPAMTGRCIATTRPAPAIRR